MYRPNLQINSFERAPRRDYIRFHVTRGTPGGTSGKDRDEKVLFVPRDETAPERFPRYSGLPERKGKTE
jgi:hypothetical protein